MALSLKINVVELNQIKTMRFNKSMSVGDACAQVSEKVGLGGNDWGFFMPPQGVREVNIGRWLKPTKTLGFYDLEADAVIEFKKRHRQLRIQLLDGTKKIVLVDDSHTVGEIVETIGLRMKIANPDEYSLQFKNPRYGITLNDLSESVSDKDSKEEAERKKKEKPVIWLNSKLSLHEQSVPDDAELVLKKKFHYTDGIIDRGDPVQLHLLYVECRNAIIQGDYPHSMKDAEILGALEFQITHGNWNPQFSLGFIINAMKEDFVSPQYRNKRELANGIQAEWKKYTGMSDANAKFRYVQQCRFLPTYGMTTWNVEARGFVEGKQADKMYPYILGLTREGLLLLDKETKEVVVNIELPLIKRYTSSEDPPMLTLDFGDYKKEYLTCWTTEGAEICELIAGYIDLILKSRFDSSWSEGRPGDEFGETLDFNRTIGGSSLANSSQYQGGRLGPQGREGINQPQGLAGRGMRPGGSHTIEISDVPSALNALQALINEMADPGMDGFVNTGLTPNQYKDLMRNHKDAVEAAAAEYLALAKGGQAGKPVMSNAIKNLMKRLMDLTDLSGQASGMGDDVDFDLFAAARRLALSITDLLNAKMDQELDIADLTMKKTLAALAGIIDGNLVDDPTHQFLLEGTNNMVAALQNLLKDARDVDTRTKGVFALTEPLPEAARLVQETAEILGAVLLDPTAQKFLDQSVDNLDGYLRNLLAGARDLHTSDQDMLTLNKAVRDVNEALRLMLLAKHIAEPRGGDLDSAAFSLQAAHLKEAYQLLRENVGHPTKMSAAFKLVVGAVNKVVESSKIVAGNADEETREALFKGIRQTNIGVDNLMKAVLNDAQDDTLENREVATKATDQLEAITDFLLEEAARLAAAAGLRRAAKKMAVATTGLVATSRTAATAAPNTQSEELRLVARDVNDSTVQLAATIKNLAAEPGAVDLQLELLEAAELHIFPTLTLVAATKRADLNIEDAAIMQRLNFAGSNTNEAVDAMRAAAAAYRAFGAYDEVREARDVVDVALNDLDLARREIESGRLQQAQGIRRDGVFDLLSAGTQKLKEGIRALQASSLALDSQLRENVTRPANDYASLAVNVRTMASLVGNQKQQLEVVQAAERHGADVVEVLRANRAYVVRPTKANKKRLRAATKAAEATLIGVLATASPVDTTQLQQASGQIEEALRALGRGGVAKDPLEATAALQAVAKNYGAAVAQLVIASKTNPRAVGGAAKIVANSFPLLVSAANDTVASVEDPKLAEAVNAALANIGKASGIVVDFAKAKLVDPSNPDLDANLDAAEEPVQAAVHDLIKLAGGNDEALADALKDVQKALKLLASGKSVEASATALADLANAARIIGAETQELVSVAATAPKQMGSHAQATAAAVKTAVQAAKALEAGVVSAPPEFLSVIGAIRATMREIVEKYDQPQALVANARTLGGKAKELAELTKAYAEKHPDNKAALQPAIQQFVQVTGEVAQAVKAAASGESNAKQELGKVNKKMEAAIANILKLVSGENAAPVDALLGVKAATEAVAEATQRALICASNVASKPRDRGHQSSLTDAASLVSKALRDLNGKIGNLSPGVADAEKALAIANTVRSQLTQTELVAAVGGLAKSSQSSPAAISALEKSSKDFTKQLSNLGKATQESASAIGKSSLAVAASLETLAKTGVGAAETAPEKSRAKTVVSLLKAVAEEATAVLSASVQLSKGSSADADERLSAASKAAVSKLGHLLSALQSDVELFKELDQVLEQLQKLSGDISASSTGNTFLESKDEFDKAIAAFGGKARAVINAQGDTSSLIASTKELVPALSEVLESASSAAGSSSPAVRQGILDALKGFAQATAGFAHAVRTLAQNPNDARAKGKISDYFAELNKKSNHLVLAVKRGAIGELECDKAIEAINQAANKLESAVLFSAAGQLTESKLEFADSQNAVTESLKALTLDASAFGSSVSGSQEEVGAAAAALAKSLVALGKNTEEMASLLKDQQHQQDVLSQARVVLSAGAALVEAGKISFRKGDQESIRTLQERAKDISRNVERLVEIMNRAAKESTRGKRLIARDAANVLELPDKYDEMAAKGTVEAEDVVIAARKLDTANARLVAAYGTHDQEQMVEASAAVREAAVALFATGKLASGLAKKTEPQKALKESLGAVAGAVSHFLSTTANSIESKTDKGAVLSQAADGARSAMAGALVRAVNQLPGGEGLKFAEDTAEDLESVAEKELLAAARAIENAAKSLTTLTRRTETDYANAAIRIGDDQINEAILAAARKITASTARLIKAAARAQAERREVAAEGGARYHADPAWANGLISAAKEVAGTTQALVVAANRAVAGEEKDEVELVATARAVAAATAQLTTASKVKAINPDGPTQTELEDAAKQVAGSTTNLVTTAKEATSFQEAAAQASGRGPRLKTGRVAEMEETTNILRLEKELDAARKELARRRKARYNR